MKKLFLALALAACGWGFAADLELERTAAVFHSYEFQDVADTPPPAGYAPFYVSHYGRHGSRRLTDSFVKDALDTLETAERDGVLTDSGRELLGCVRKIAAVHEGMEGQLAERGAEEHRRLARRMADRFPAVFAGKRRVRCQSSIYPRVLLSQANFTTTLKGAAPALDFEFVTGDKIHSVINHRRYDGKNIGKRRHALCDAAARRDVNVKGLVKRLFAPRAKVKDPFAFARNLFVCASCCQCLSVELGGMDIYRFFSKDEIAALSRDLSAQHYGGMGNSEEFGDNGLWASQFLARNFIERADEALSDGTVAADLRFGHDSGIWPIAGLIGLEGPGDRVPMMDAWQKCPPSKWVPMAANIQMAFYRNDSGDVLVKILFNEREMRIRGLAPRVGPYYAWTDFRAHVLRAADAIRTKMEGGAPTSEKPLKVAVYVGEGARTAGVYRWLELIACASGVESVPVDAAAVKAGALDGVDTLVVPGGRSVQMSKQLGPEGRKRVKAFVARGGGYVGTCAGCCLAMESAKSHPDMLNMIPYTFGEAGGHDQADLLIRFNGRAEALAGIPKGSWRVSFSKGPVLVPSLPVSEAEVEVVATFASDVNATGGKARTSMAGQAAAVAGTYGRGRIFVMAVHPEYDVVDHAILRGAFRYVAQREVSWTVPQRKRGQLAVGVVCDNSFGVDTARFIQRVVRSSEFDLVPLKSSFVTDGALRHLDAVLVPDALFSGKPSLGLFGMNKARTKEFLDHGGRVFAWGRPAEAACKEEPRVERVADGDAALAALRAFASGPAPVPPPLPKKVAKPLRAAIYADKGGSNVPLAELLSLAPEYDLKVLDAEDYRSGALDGVDLLVQPGGMCHVQYNRLGTNGVNALRKYVYGGGRYYGICAGAFLASQTTKGYPRIGLIPFKHDVPEHYRGWGPINVSFTDDGREVFGKNYKSRTVMYWGGPAFVKGDPVPDTDVKVLATYSGRIINTLSSSPVMEMRGKGAIVGGRVGKGRVFVTCTHPEKSEGNFDIVRGGIKYLTGVAPSEVNHGRARGAVSVFFRAAKEKRAAEFYLGTLLRDGRFDARAGSSLSADMLPHLDAVVIPAPRKDEGQAVPYLRAFVANGGRVVVVADTEAKRKLAKKIPGAVVVDSYDKIIDAML